MKKFLIIRVQQRDFRAANPLEKFSSVGFRKLRIHRFDYQKERIIGDSIEWFMIEKRMMQPGQPVYRAIVEHFGPKVELAGGELNRAELARLAGEQAALRRVATLVARGRPSSEVFAEVAREVGELLNAESAWMDRYDDDGKATVVASWGAGGRELPVGARFTLDGESVVALVRQTGRSARVDDYARAAGEAFGVFVRSQHAHAVIKGIDRVHGTGRCTVRYLSKEWWCDGRACEDRSRAG